MVVSGYPIGGHFVDGYWWLLMAIDGYSINDYW